MKKSRDSNFSAFCDHLDDFCGDKRKGLKKFKRLTCLEWEIKLSLISVT